MTTSRLLDGTWLSFAYAFFWAEDDSGIISAFNFLIGCSILGTIVWNLVGKVAYGKASHEISSKSEPSFFRAFWETPIPARFTWRYGFLPSVIVPWAVILWTPVPYLSSPLNLGGLAIYYVHYFNRSVIYPSKISDKATPCPLWFFLFVTLATTLLAFVQSHHLLNLHPLGAPSIGTFIGIGLSVGGAWINNYHDGLLTSLRGRGQGYQIPSGGLFDLVSCANYFGEVLEWCGWACVTRGGSPQVMFALFSTVFLVLRARFTHSWYKTRFGAQYPGSRRAIIPFIY